MYQSAVTHRLDLLIRQKASLMFQLNELVAIFVLLLDDENAQKSL